MPLEAVIFFVWLIIGIINLFSERISKFQYFMVWFVLLINIILRGN